MTIKIHRFLKSDLSRAGSLNVIASGMSNTSGMTISHYAGAYLSTEATIPFDVEIVRDHVPKINNIDFCVVMRTKVDLDAIGPNEGIIKELGDDTGKYNYKNSVPSIPLDLPSGFQELYKG